MDLTKLTMDELISLRNKIEGLIHSYEDGYIYICSVRQFGSVWEERPTSLYSLKELCGEYNGDNGIVDVVVHSHNAIGSGNMMGYINNYRHINRLKQNCIRLEWDYTIEKI